ncbi:ABC transporter permease [Anaerofilum sp. BX8]|uniref:ABC transporter permease n=1 Tax=Anaerofilum hominis TaxID=2763016 RepID=A0A923I7V4_9FIRM|nr:ABC transporter permease [Anaerofilum hominis]MBC5581896.1 ABC transporter permease [Anaerofilum hominis]
MKAQIQKRNIKNFLQNNVILLFLLLLCIFFAVSSDKFLTANNLFLVIRQVSVLGVASLAAAIITLSGGLDISIGNQMTLYALVAAHLMVNRKMSMAVAIPAALCLSLVVGFIIGYVINKFQINPFVATLAFSTVFSGISFGITGGYQISHFSDAFKFISQGYIGAVPMPVILMLIILIAGAFVLNKTCLGRYIYSVGGNEEASRLSGINTQKIKVGAYVAGGFLAGIAAIMMAARLNSVSTTCGDGYTFDAMTAIMLGGVSVRGGKGKVSGILIGILIIGVLNNGLTLIGVESFIQNIVKGLIMLAAICSDSVIYRKRG